MFSAPGYKRWDKHFPFVVIKITPLFEDNPSKWKFTPSVGTLSDKISLSLELFNPVD